MIDRSDAERLATEYLGRKSDSERPWELISFPEGAESPEGWLIREVLPLGRIGGVTRVIEKSGTMVTFPSSVPPRRILQSYEAVRPASPISARSVSPFLADFFETYCASDKDMPEIAELVHGTLESHYVKQIHDELSEAIDSGAVTSNLINEWTSRAVFDVEQANTFLRALWLALFPAEPPRPRT